MELGISVRFVCYYRVVFGGFWIEMIEELDVSIDFYCLLRSFVSFAFISFYAVVSFRLASRSLRLVFEFAGRLYFAVVVFCFRFVCRFAFV